MMIQIAVCDDEPFMLDDIAERLAAYMAEKKSACEISCYSNGKEILESGLLFDILFLDIQMEEPDGMETARRLRAQGFNGLLIFITVLREHVFDSFEVQAFDYLVKPLEDLRLRRTMERAIKILERYKGGNIVFQKGGSCQVIALSDIMYGEVLGRKIYIHRHGGEIVDYYSKLEDFAKRMDSRFFRCHRSYLVNLDYVCGTKAGFVLLSDGEKIPVSRLREQELLQALLAHMKERRS